MKINVDNIIKQIINKNLSKTTNEESTHNPIETSTPNNDYTILKNSCVFKFNESQDSKIKLYSSCSSDCLNVFILNENTGNLLTKKFILESNQSKSIFDSCISLDGSFSLAIDSYYSDSPHRELDLFLFNPMGDEKIHIHYCKDGYRKTIFSDSGRYFFVTSSTQVIVWDLLNNSSNIFFPEDIKNISPHEIYINEAQKTIGLHYTQHPDAPIYHFTFSGLLLENDLFQEQLVKNETQNKSVADKYFLLLKEVNSLTRPITKEDYTKYSSIFLSYIDSPTFKDYQSWLYRYLGEFVLDYGEKDKALLYFKKALELNPSVGVKRLVSKLEKELSGTTKN